LPSAEHVSLLTLKSVYNEVYQNPFQNRQLLSIKFIIGLNTVKIVTQTVLLFILIWFWTTIFTIFTVVTVVIWNRLIIWRCLLSWRVMLWGGHCLRRFVVAALFRLMLCLIVFTFCVAIVIIYVRCCLTFLFQNFESFFVGIQIRRILQQAATWLIIIFFTTFVCCLSIFNSLVINTTRFDRIPLIHMF